MKPWGSADEIPIAAGWVSGNSITSVAREKGITISSRSSSFASADIGSAIRRSGGNPIRVAINATGGWLTFMRLLSHHASPIRSASASKLEETGNSTGQPYHPHDAGMLAGPHIAAALRCRLAAVFRNAGYFYIAAFGLAIVAFWPRYLAILPAGGISGYFHLHALVMTAWFALLIAQPLLIRAGRRSVHRALGKISYGLAPLIIVAGLLLAHARLPPEAGPGFAVAAVYTYLPFGMFGVFALAYVLGVMNRRDQPLHARYMLCTGLALVDPIVTRLIDIYVVSEDSWFAHARLEQAVSYLVSVAILGVLMVRERGQTRGRAAFPVMLGAITVAYGLWFAVAQGQAWQSFMRWFAALPIT